MLLWDLAARYDKIISKEDKPAALIKTQTDSVKLSSNKFGVPLI